MRVNQFVNRVGSPLTRKMYRAAIGDDLRTRYPDLPTEDREGFRATIDLNDVYEDWMHHLADMFVLIGSLPTRTLDTLSATELYDLRKHYLPVGAELNYTPREIRRRVWGEP